MVPPASEQHELHDGRFVIRGSRIFQMDTLDDTSLGITWTTTAGHLRPADGTIDIDVNEISNAGSFRVELRLTEVLYIVVLYAF